MRGYFVVRQREGFPKEYMTSTGAWTDRQVAAVVFTLADEASFEPVVPDGKAEAPRWKGPVVVRWGDMEFWSKEDLPRGLTSDLVDARVFNHVNHARNSLSKRGYSDSKWVAVPVDTYSGVAFSLVPGYQPITLFPKSR